MQVLEPYEYFEPVTVKDAAEILVRYGSKVKLLAGGLDLIRRRINEQTSNQFLRYKF